MLRRVVYPPAVIVFSTAAVPLLWRAAGGESAAGLILGLWPKPTSAAWAMVAILIGLELVLWAVIPARICPGPITPAGNRVTYRINGFAACIVTNALLVTAASGLHWFSLAGIYDRLGSIFTVCSLLGFALTVFAYLKGRWFPATADAGSRGGFLADLCWGMELHPRLGRLDLKHFAITRFGMIGWNVILLACWAKQPGDAMSISIALQLVYILKFFWWESGYLFTLDLAHDRMGFMLAWGGVTWLPCVYSLSAQYLAAHPRHLGSLGSAALLTLGLAAIACNYCADRQRQRVRETGGRCTVFGKPPELIGASYRTSDGQTHKTVLLASGWWGVSRHFNYLPEIASALTWTLPCGYGSPVPYFFPVFLTFLLVHRSFRDDARCLMKYGDAWIEYRRRVPYQMVPGVF